MRVEAVSDAGSVYAIIDLTIFKYRMTRLIAYIVFVTLVGPSLLLAASCFVQREHILITEQGRVVLDYAVWSVYPHVPSQFAELLDAEIAALPHERTRTIEHCVVSLLCVIAEKYVVSRASHDVARVSSHERVVAIARWCERV